ALHTLAVGNLAHREALVQARAAAADADAFISLDARAFAFDDLHIHFQGVAGLKIRDFLAFGDAREFLALQRFDDIHGNLCARIGRLEFWSVRDRRRLYDMSRALSFAFARAPFAPAPKIGPPLAGETLRLRPPPSLNLCMIPGNEHFRDPPALERLGPRILRVFEESSLKALFAARGVAAHDSRQQPDTGVDQHI